MIVSTDITIADALRRYLDAQIRARPTSRSFFRVSGFSEGSYAALLDSLDLQGWQIADKPLNVRSIDPIPGHAERAMDRSRSATWYRNTLADGHALVLIQNRRSSDAQSLKDLYPVTEITLSNDGIDQLIDACFAGYQLNVAERKQLIDFVRRLSRAVHEPQLRDLAEFLVATDQVLIQRPGLPIAEAIVRALPYLGLFRCHELTDQINTSRGEKLIRQLRAAARIGNEVLDERVRGDYLARLNNTSLVDDAALGGLSAERKRELIRRFIDGQLREYRDELLQLLQIDWREIQGVIQAKSRVSRQEKLVRVADQLEDLVSQGSLGEGEAGEVIADLRAGSEPDDDTLDRLIADTGDALPKALRNEIQRLSRPRSRQHSDFLVGLTSLAVELLQPLQGELAPGSRLKVSVILGAIDSNKHLPDALHVFRALYGGVERTFPAISWEIASLWTSLEVDARGGGDEEEEPERQRVIRVDIPFRVIVLGPDANEIVSARLIWQYRSDSPAAATTQTLAAERSLLGSDDFGPLFNNGAPKLRVPVYNSCPLSDEIGDIDIRRPIQSFGVWYEAASDLRELLNAQLQSRSRPQSREALDQALTRLEHAWVK